MKLLFYIKYKTSFGQSLWISDNGELGADLIRDAIPMKYLNDEFWYAELKIEKHKASRFHYKYILRNPDGEIIPEPVSDRVIEINKKKTKEIVLIDTWNFPGEYQNVFYTDPFREVLLKRKPGRQAKSEDGHFTHVFKVKLPLLTDQEIVCLTGNRKPLSAWSEVKPVLMKKDGDWWIAKLDLSDEEFPVSYKYAIYNKSTKKLTSYEKGDNRIVHKGPEKNRVTILHDGFARYPNNTWKGCGVSVPVASLRSVKSFGSGEFTDLKLLADWANKTGIKLIQVLPVNDTIATRTWKDSYPYAAISAFALHPIYINLQKTAGRRFQAQIRSSAAKRKELNNKETVDYNAVVEAKLKILRNIYDKGGYEDLLSEEFTAFFSKNKFWLRPYAVFCYLRDKFGTSDFNQWTSQSVYNRHEIEKLAAAKSPVYRDIAFYYFIQYHLHLQLKDAARYLHKKGVILKGDIPIGVYRYGCDAWMGPELYHISWQAGAPPDDFAVRGQNWGFPTYNWEKMQENHFDWWRKRFEQMSNYFDAFRIDHILGFFRIWSIPLDEVEGIMGRFVPAIPVLIQEFGEKGIWFDMERFCDPYITEEIILRNFGDMADYVKENFLVGTASGTYKLADSFDTQQKVEQFFDGKTNEPATQVLKAGLFDLISNRILFEEKGSGGTKFHFRINMENTLSFQYLEHWQQIKLKGLYVDYFFRRQDRFWFREAMHKLPYLKRATNMLICGEDLGMVPDCVPEVMGQLGILSLEIQRMPKNPETEFFHPDHAPYLSVITPSTHDMSTIRGWWEEDRQKIQRFYNQELGQQGAAPLYCEPWINRAVVLQHLYSPAICAIFQLQDILGMSEKLRRENPQEERINVPADPDNHWKYRMHIFLEDLLKEDEFNEELKGYIHHSGR